MVCGRSAPRISMAAAAPPRGGLRRPRPRSRPGPAAARGLWGPAEPLRAPGPGRGSRPGPPESPVPAGSGGKASERRFRPVGAGGRRRRRRRKEQGRAGSSSGHPREFPAPRPLRDLSSIPSLAPSAPQSPRMWCWRLAWLLRGPCQQRGSSGRRWLWPPHDTRTMVAALTRGHHTAPGSLPCAWQLHGDHLELRYGSTLMRLDFVWLRDHCRSASCYNAKTNQRSLDTASVDLAIRPQAVRVDDTTLFLTWPDGHVTRYGLEWLVKNSYEGQKKQVMHPRILWNAEIYRQAQVPSVDCRSFLETDEGLKEFLQNFLLYGIAFVENVTPTKEDTEILAERISIIRETIYGRMWYFTSDFSRGDTAYTKLALDRHTDTTYFQEPCGGIIWKWPVGEEVEALRSQMELGVQTEAIQPMPPAPGQDYLFPSEAMNLVNILVGKELLRTEKDGPGFWSCPSDQESIQVFHCLKHEGTGGRTLLVDGFHAAEQVLRRAPEQFELLSKVPLKHEYVENVGGCHNHMIGVGPVLNVYPWNNELYLIRYNNYDRAVINTVPYDVVRRWYHAHRTLTTELRRPENELWVKLKPGKALFVDNWRVLHGREAFTGYRQLCGCYLTRDDVLNTARLLGLQA